MPLRYLRIFQLKLKWMKYCVSASNGTDDLNVNTDNIIFTSKDTKLYASVVTLLAKKQSKTIKTS